MESDVSRMKMPHVRDCAIAVMCRVLRVSLDILKLRNACIFHQRVEKGVRNRTQCNACRTSCLHVSFLIVKLYGIYNPFG